ncbi:MAG: helix-turn-helix domain-containing protein [Dehalococcoidales bacterium]|jgi:DNA-binding transcriptional regulator YiaG|nr:helix-turn-helix domain-containing protein [Dehalococcoidales bacterium]
MQHYNAGQKSWDDKKIKALRKHLGLTQQEMAGQLGTRQQTISEWELGLYRPRGASSTLLSMVADRSGFMYDASPPEQKSSR